VRGRFAESREEAVVVLSGVVLSRVWRVRETAATSTAGRRGGGVSWEGGQEPSDLSMLQSE